MTLRKSCGVYTSTYPSHTVSAREEVTIHFPLRSVTNCHLDCHLHFSAGQKGAADPKPAQGVSLTRFMEVIPGKLVGPDHPHPDGWTQGEWDARQPLSAGTERPTELLRSRRVRTPEGTGTLLWWSREHCGIWLHATGKTIQVPTCEVKPGRRKR